MTKPPKKRRRRPPSHPAMDLFGQVPVTWEEVFTWLECVPGIPRHSPRALAYIEGWDVPGKIRAAKLAGTFEAATAAPSESAQWSRLAGLLDMARRRR